MTEKQLAYSVYLKSNNWKYIRQKALERDKFKCFECHSTNNLQVHHVHYRKSPYQTKITDLVTLCNNCHEKEHNIQRDENNKIVHMEQMGEYLKPVRPTMIYDYPKCPFKVMEKQKRNKKRRDFLKFKRKNSKFSVGIYHI